MESAHRVATIFESPEKAKYREIVADILQGSRDPYRFAVAYLGGPEAQDAKSYLKRGILPENQFYIERDKATFDMAKRQHHIKGINMIHDSAANAFDKIARDHGRKLAAANLDFCGYLTESMFDEIAHCMKSGAFQKRFRIAITFGGSRDKHGAALAWEYFDGDRIALLHHGIAHMTGFNVRKIWRGEYQSNLTPMKYVIFQVSQ